MTTLQKRKHDHQQKRKHDQNMIMIIKHDLASNLVHKKEKKRKWASLITDLNYSLCTVLGFFLSSSGGRESTAMQETLGLIPGLGSSPGEGLSTHSSILAWRIPVDRGAWQAAVHGIAMSRTQLKWLSSRSSKAQMVESTCSVGDLDSIPELGRSRGRGHGNPFQYSCLENPCG